MEAKMKNSNLVLNGKTHDTSASSVSKSAMIRVKKDLGGRLPSFKPPRDLSLSGPSPSISTLKNMANAMATNKKAFVPNVNVVRRKGQSLPTSNDAKLNTKDIKPNLERSRRGPKSKGNFIQTQGVFSDGLSKAPPKEYGNRREEAPVAQLEKPKLNLKRNTNKKHEDIKMKELLKDDFIDDLSIIPDFCDYPMSLPLLIKKKNQHFDSLEATFDSLQFKTEKDNELSSENDKNSPSIFETFDDLSSSKLMVFEFPDELRDIMPVEKVDKVKKEIKEEKGAKVTDKEESNQRLANLGDGRWGTLKILKNGSAYIAVGDEIIPVEMSMHCAKQNVMSVDFNSSSSRGSVINLGCVDKSFACSSELKSK